MTSTVTRATLCAVANVALANSLTLIAILTLLTLLVQKGLAAVDDSQVANKLKKILDVGIIPLFIGFMAKVAVRIFEALQ
jgi:hypothetical protein